MKACVASNMLTDPECGFHKLLEESEWLVQVIVIFIPALNISGHFCQITSRLLLFNKRGQPVRIRTSFQKK